MSEHSPIAGWIVLAAALLTALILTAEHYALGRQKMNVSHAIRHCVGLTTILAGVWLWAIAIRWAFPALVFMLMMSVGSAFMALWYLLDYRVSQIKRAEGRAGTSGWVEGWMEEPEPISQGDDHDLHPHLLSDVHHGLYQEAGSGPVEQGLSLWDGRPGAREIRIRPGEEIVVENGRIVVREVGGLNEQ